MTPGPQQPTGSLAGQVFGGQAQPPQQSGQDLEAMWRGLMAGPRQGQGAQPGLMAPPPGERGEMGGAPMMQPPPGEAARGMDVGAPPPLGGAPTGPQIPPPYSRPYSAMLFGRSAPMAPWRMIEEEAKRQALIQKMRPQRVGQNPDAVGAAQAMGGFNSQDYGVTDPGSPEFGPAGKDTFSI